MPELLPSAPSLEQLRKLARELLRAAAAGEAGAQTRLAPYVHSGPARLCQAQLAVAREYGFPSWPTLRAYVERRSTNPGALRAFRSDVAYYEDRAGGLLSVYRSGLPSAMDLFRRHHPRFAASTPADIATAPVTLEDARLVLGRQHGFASWEGLCRHVRSLGRGVAYEPFMAAFQAMERRSVDEFTAVVAAHPDVLRAQGTNGNSLLNILCGMLVSPDCSRGPSPELIAEGLAGVRLLLAAGADVNQANDRGWSPLHQAAYNGDAALAALLLEAGARCDTSAHGEGGTPLTAALFWGHREVAEALAEVAVTPRNLRVAAGLGRADLIRELVPSPGQPSVQAGTGRDFYRPHTGFPLWQPSNRPQEILDEALVWSARSGRVDVFELLVSLGACPNADPYRGTALAWAAANNRVAAIRRLIEMGADPSQPGTFGGPGHGQNVTPLHLAAQGGNLDACRVLLELGADPTPPDALYFSPPWGWAEHFGEAATATLVRAAAAKTSVLAAVALGAADAVCDLLASDPGQANDDRYASTPLSLAARNGRDDLVRVLLAAGAQPDLRERGTGRTPAEIARAEGHEELARLIAEAGVFRSAG